MMPPKIFWDIIEASKRPTEDGFLPALHRVLLCLSPEEIVGFESRLWHYLGEANRDDLWGALYPLQGGCSDDSFMYFRCWLIAQGRRVFESAVADPDSLADLPPSTRYRLEGLLSSAHEAWGEKTGNDEYGFEMAEKNAEQTPYPDPVKADWDVKDEGEMRKRWPRLMAKRSRRQA
jgi:hypothetical protein